MTLVLGTHYEYETTGRYFYLTPVGAELLTGIDDIDVEWKNAERRLKNQGKQLKLFMTLCSNDTKEKYKSRQDYIEYAQWTDTASRDSVLQMLGEYAEWAYDIDGDRIVYEERNPFDAFNMLPLTIKIEGSNSGMLGLFNVQFIVPEDEYQIGY